MSPMLRFNVIKKYKLCINCLGDSHKVNSCPSKYKCKFCNASHNSLLHRNEGNSRQTETQSPTIESRAIGDSQTPAPPLSSQNTNDVSSDDFASHVFATTKTCKNKTIILSTALIWIWSPGRSCFVKGRCLLDCGSMVNLMTSEFANRLEVKKEKINVPISGLGGNETNVKYKLNSIVCNANSSFSVHAEFLVVPKITDFIPSTALNLENITNMPDRLLLADPSFATPGKIDMILGAEYFFDIIKEGKHRISENLIFQDSVFGFIASGAFQSKNSKQYCGLISQVENIDSYIRKFWELEEIPTSHILSKEEEFCEIHFQKTHKRNESGRYIVKMPTHEEALHMLGESRPIAEKRLNQTVRRLNADPQMKRLYSDFISEYEHLNHMERVREDASPLLSYYMPHHGVFNPEKTSTKLRVVFNASTPTSTGRSLNEILMTGEVKEDVFELIVRFRKHKIALIADIKQMFRQILIDPTQKDLLRILWKNQKDEKPKVFRMNTVTYGTKCAPFLAIRTLKQLAMDEHLKYPMAAEVALTDIYMDDIVTGSQDIESAAELKHQLIKMFQSCGMKLHKWNSNSTTLINDGISNEEFAFNSNESTKTLGIIWHPGLDKFTFKVCLKKQSVFTKRDVLSVIARLYDPLGFLGPVITRAKILLQKLWSQHLSWDDPLPEPVAQEWIRFVSHLKDLENIKIDRYVLSSGFEKITIAGFADASTSAYGAVVYLHPQFSNSPFKLLASKSRVAPLKTISVPRLELCACLLLSTLVHKVIDSLKMEINEVILFSDSTIALAWINSSPHQLKTFVANRVSKIQTLSEHYQWRHIPSELNPADFISRGIDPTELESLDLWFFGPSNLDIPLTDKEETKNIDNELYECEFKKLPDVTLTLTSKIDFIDSFLNLSNNFVKLIRILSFVFRFISNCQKGIKILGPITRDEFDHAKLSVVKSVQV